MSDGARTRGSARAGTRSSNGAGPDESVIEAARERVTRSPLPSATVAGAARLFGTLAAEGASAVAG